MAQTALLRQQPHSTTSAPLNLKAADAVWVATALLHELHPSRRWFSVAEIEEMVRRRKLSHCAEKTIYHHAQRHCVANLKPHSNRTRMLLEVGDGERRLFRPGDPSDSGRQNAPWHPVWNDLPAQYRHLQAWYESWLKTSLKPADDPLLALIGTWSYGEADEYVASLRDGWDDRP